VSRDRVESATFGRVCDREAARRSVAVLGATLAPEASAKSTIVRFQTPSKNIGCIYFR